MTEQPQITLREALELVIFRRNDDATWCVEHVRGAVWGNVWGSVKGYVKGCVGGNVYGNVWGSVKGYVKGYVGGNVYGTISGRKWQFVNETPKEKLKRLIEEGADKSQLLEAFNQLENNQ